MSSSDEPWRANPKTDILSSGSRLELGFYRLPEFEVELFSDLFFNKAFSNIILSFLFILKV